jgi:hypothetical protein
MAILKVKKQKHNIIVDSFNDVKKNSTSFFTRINFITIFMIASSVFSPNLWLFFLLLSFFLFNTQMWNRYFKHKEAISYYLKEFSCVSADNGTKVFSNFGYTVDQESEWDTHLEKLQDFNLPEDAKDSELKEYAETLAKEVKKVRNRQKHREFGIGKDIATRHILFIGTTGSGKTETIMSWLNDVLKVENSGGCVFIDGKAGTDMHAKLSSLIELHNRETSSYTMSFLKADKMSSTNTYNSILTMSPYKGVAFMGSLLPSSEGGNGDYFKNRGTAMLTLPLSALRIRNEFYGEPFSLAVLQSSTSTMNISILFFLFYGMIREQNDIIKESIGKNKKLTRIWQEAKNKSTPINQDMEYYEKLLNYVTQYKPSAKKDIEDIIGYDFKLFFSAFNLTFQMSRLYMTEISPEWGTMSNAVAEVMYVHAKVKEKRNFGVTYSNPVSLEDVRRWQGIINDVNTINEITKDPLYTGNPSTIDQAKNGFGLNEGANTPSLANLPEQSKTQHGYSQQQWTTLFQAFGEFPNVFGSPFPDVDMQDILKNNKVLYVLLPALELGEEKTKVLGKMLIRDMQESGSVTLGGENLSITPTQDTLYKDKITPKPLSLMIADEYGYYRVEGNSMSAILAQFRSLNMCAMLSMQNVAGIGGDEETKTALANTAKFVLKSYDTDIREFVETQIGEVDTVETQKYLDTDKNIKESISSNIEVKKEKTFDVSVLGDMMFGCGVFICNSKPVIVQSYYFGGDKVEPYISSMERYTIND